MMKTAFAVWNHRIAPVFDVTRQIHLVEAESGRIVSEAEESLPDDPGTGRGLRLAELGVDTLVCGAISRPMQAMVTAYGIRVIPFLAGDLREVIQAWLSGVLEKEVFAMPGCCREGRRRRFQGVCNLTQEEYLMKGRNQGKMNPRGGQGRGRMGERPGGGPGGKRISNLPFRC
ncbi:MAG: NifB/NifX family molybdenum-iron cluster-binding protein [Thermodesulfobacteriota bacterium]